MVPLGMENTTTVPTVEQFFAKFGFRPASIILDGGAVARGFVHGDIAGKRTVRIHVAFKVYRDGTVDDTYTGVMDVDAGTVHYSMWLVK